MIDENVGLLGEEGLLAGGQAMRLGWELSPVIALFQDNNDIQFCTCINTLNKKHLHKLTTVEILWRKCLVFVHAHCIHRNKAYANCWHLGCPLRDLKYHINYSHQCTCRYEHRVEDTMKVLPKSPTCSCEQQHGTRHQVRRASMVFCIHVLRDGRPGVQIYHEQTGKWTCAGILVCAEFQFCWWHLNDHSSFMRDVFSGVDM